MEPKRAASDIIKKKLYHILVANNTNITYTKNKKIILIGTYLLLNPRKQNHCESIAKEPQIRSIVC